MLLRFGVIALAAAAPLIPNRLIFTYKTNLLTAQPSTLSVPDRVLWSNVRHTIRHHPGAEVVFLDDAACRALIGRVAGPGLQHAFDLEFEGMYKADLCRGAALWDGGGLYMDVDLLSRTDTRVLLRPGTTYATVVAATGEGFFQAFWAAAPRHPAVGRYLQYFREYYDSRRSVTWLVGAQLALHAFRDTDVDNASTQLWEETHRDQDPRVDPVSVPHQWGRGCCCNYVVLDPVTGVVPFYSRIIGVSKCAYDDFQDLR